MIDPKTRLSRSMMFVPGNSPKMINNCDLYGADSIMFDIEDSIPIAEKDVARILVAEALKSRTYKGETVVRINHPTQTPYGIDDLEVILQAKPNLIRMPKTECKEEVELVAAMIDDVEKQNGWVEGTINIIVAIESVRGLYNVREICHAPRMVAIALGAEDFIADIKTQRTKYGIELYFARSTILMAAREAGIRCIDTVFSDVNDMDGFCDEVTKIRDMGFDGKSCIHPKQIAEVHKLFTPTEKQIIHAVKVLISYADAKKKNKGVIAVDGKMVDGPIVVRAQRIVDAARAAGLTVELEEQA